MPGDDMMDDDLEGGPSDTDELPSPLGSSAPPVVLDIPAPPTVPRFDREAATMPPAPGETDWVDTSQADPMAGAPNWARHLCQRVDALITETMRAQQMANEFMQRDAERKKAIESLEDGQQEHDRRLRKIENRVDALEKAAGK